MSSPVSMLVGAARRVGMLLRPARLPRDRGGQALHVEHMETILAAAGHTLGECPSWVIVALEHAERDKARGVIRDERMPS